MSNIQRIETFMNDGLTFNVIDTGPIDGEIIVLLHGWPQTAKSWHVVSEQLNQHGYRTIAPTQRGYSPQARPSSRFSYRMSNLVGDIVALMKKIDSDAVHLVGHDWGSSVAWALAAKYPQYVKTFTSVSVPHSGAFMQSMLSSDQFFRVYYMGLFQLPKMPELMASHCPNMFKKMLQGTGLTESEVETIYTDVIDQGAFGASINWYRAMFLLSPADMKRKVSVPTMHIWGDQDNALSRKSAELTKNFTTGFYRLEVLSGATHWIPLQNPNELSQLILKLIAANAS